MYFIDLTSQKRPATPLLPSYHHFWFLHGSRYSNYPLSLPFIRSLTPSVHLNSTINFCLFYSLIKLSCHIMLQLVNKMSQSKVWSTIWYNLAPGVFTNLTTYRYVDQDKLSGTPSIELVSSGIYSIWGLYRLVYLLQVNTCLVPGNFYFSGFFQNPICTSILTLWIGMVQIEP